MLLELAHDVSERYCIPVISVGNTVCSFSFHFAFPQCDTPALGLEKKSKSTPNIAMLAVACVVNRLLFLFPYGNILIPLCSSNNVSHLSDFNDILHFNTPNMQFRETFRPYNNGILYYMEVHIKPKDVGNGRVYCKFLFLGHPDSSGGRNGVCFFDTTTLELRCCISDIVV